MKYLAFITSILVLSACRPTKNGNTNTFTNDSTVYVIFKPDMSVSHLIKPATLSADELIVLEELIQKRITQYNAMLQQKRDSIMKVHPKSNPKVWHQTITLSKYKRQYVPVINSSGQKSVWVNCLCNAFGKDWKKEVIMVMDGGNCYFNLSINLTTKTCESFAVNGLG